MKAATSFDPRLYQITYLSMLLLYGPAVAALRCLILSNLHPIGVALLKVFWKENGERHEHEAQTLA